MTEIDQVTDLFADPLTWLIGGGAFILFVVIMLIISARRSALAASESGKLAQNLQTLTGNLNTIAMQQAQVGQLMEQRLGEVQLGMQENLARAQQRTGEHLAHIQQNLADSLGAQQLTLSETLGHNQMRLQENMADLQLKTGRALTDMQERLNEALAGTAKSTATSLSALQERLETIDKAQENITRLSGDVLSLQDILSNKQTRGAFGEIQLTDIVSKALPKDSYSLQATLSNGKRADCLIYLPNPPGPIAIDAKFPLEGYEALRCAKTDAELAEAARFLRSTIRKHIKDIAERYIIDGETADGALMFLPSEAVYAELHANFADVVREGFAAKVWIVSPTTCMATLNTMRAILKDARMREQAGAIRVELASLYSDVDRLGLRVGNLDRHFTQAAKDVAEIKISADKAGRRAKRLDNFDFEDLAQEDGQVVKLPGE